MKLRRKKRARGKISIEETVEKLVNCCEEYLVAGLNHKRFKSRVASQEKEAISTDAPTKT